MSSSRSRPSGSSSSARKPIALTKPLTSEQIREKEHKEFLLALLQSHAGWLNKPIASLSDTIVMDITYTSSILGIVYFVFLLISPAFLSPHISALITLVIPVQCTVRTVVMEKVKDVKQSQNAPQWVFYWVIYVLWGMARGWISTFRPGYKAVFEVVRTVGLVVIGGPWFGRAGLRPDPPSEELKKAEKEEAVKAAEKKKLADKDKLKNDKAKTEAAEKAKKQKEKERAKRAKA